MDAYDVMMDKYRAEQRFRQEVKEEVARLKCQDKCKADSTRQYCVGCLRTIKEITECGIKTRKAKEDPR